MAKHNDSNLRGIRGGARRSRSKHAPQYKLGPLAAPDHGATRGYCFPDTPATPDRMAKLRSLFVAYLRLETLTRWSRVENSVLGELFGVSGQRVGQLRKEFSQEFIGKPAPWLAVNVLHAMHSGFIPNVRNTPHDEWVKDCFYVVYELSRSRGRGGRFVPVSVEERFRYADDPDLLHEETDTFHMWLAAFRIEYERWIHDGDG